MLILKMKCPFVLKFTFDTFQLFHEYYTNKDDNPTKPPKSIRNFEYSTAQDLLICIHKKRWNTLTLKKHNIYGDFGNLEKSQASISVHGNFFDNLP